MKRFLLGLLLLALLGILIYNLPPVKGRLAWRHVLGWPFRFPAASLIFKAWAVMRVFLIDVVLDARRRSRPSIRR